MAKLYQSKAYMTRLYRHDRLTPEEIAIKLNVSHMTIYRYLKKFELIK